MVAWNDVIKNPAFTDLDPADQLQIRAEWYDTNVVPGYVKEGLTPEQIAPIRQKDITEFDNGQGYITSFLSSGIRGAAGTFTSGIEGVGGLLGSQDIQDVGASLQRGAEEILPVNPSLTKTNFVGNAIGNAAATLLPMGAGAAAGKALGVGMKLGGTAGSLSNAFLGGAGQGTQMADQYGIQGTDKQSNAFLGGLTELGSETVFGPWSELKALSKVPGLGALADSRAGGLGHAIGTNTVEEVISQGGSNLSTKLLAPPGVQGPSLTEGMAESAAGGAIGGAFFGGVGLLGTHKSDAAAAGAASRAAALGDPEAAAIISFAGNRVQERALVITPPDISAAGDTTTEESIDINDYANQNPIIGGLNDQQTPAPLDTPVPGIAAETAQEPLIPPIPGTEAAPPVAGEQAAQPVPEAPMAPVAEAPLVQPIPGQEAQQPLVQPVQPVPGTQAPVQQTPQAPVEAMPREQERALLDVHGRLTTEAATTIFQAMKQLGVTNANLQFTEGEEYDGGPKNQYIGLRPSNTEEGVVLLNRNLVRGDTVAHEAIGHGALADISKTNPALYAQAKAILTGSPLMEAVRQRYARFGSHYTEEGLLAETLATAYGNQSAEFWQKYAGKGDFARRMQQWLAKFTEWVKDLMRSKGVDPDMTMSQLAGRINQQAMSGRLKESGVADIARANSWAAGVAAPSSLPPNPASTPENSPAHGEILSSMTGEDPEPVKASALEGGRVRTIARKFHDLYKTSQRIDWTKNWKGSKKEFAPGQEAKFKKDISRAATRITEVLRVAHEMYPKFQSWYETRIKMALDIFAELDPEVRLPENNFALRVLLAVTSNGNKVKEQTEDTWKVYQEWKATGKLGDTKVRGARSKEIGRALQRVDELVDKFGWEKIDELLSKSGTVRELRSELVSAFEFTPKEAEDITNGEMIDEVVPFALIFGAKLGSFYNNLSGNFDTTTMDRWFMRTFGRAMGTQLAPVDKAAVAQKRARLNEALVAARQDPQAAGILKSLGISKSATASQKTVVALADYFEEAANREGLSKASNDLRLSANGLFKVEDGYSLVEAPTAGAHRRFIRLAMGEARDRFAAETGKDWSAAELQALLWYFEKSVHDLYGSKQRDETPDYGSAANDLYRGLHGTDARAFEPSDAVRGRSLKGEGMGIMAGTNAEGERSTGGTVQEGDVSGGTRAPPGPRSAVPTEGLQSNLETPNLPNERTATQQPAPGPAAAAAPAGPQPPGTPPPYVNRSGGNTHFRPGAQGSGIAGADQGLHVTPEQFSAAARQNKESHPFGTSVDVYEPDSYEGYDLILIEKDGQTATASVSPDGELGAVTKSPGGDPVMVADAIAAAVATGNVKWLNGFDTVLPRIYSGLGFKTVARIPFNEEYQPDGWDQNTYQKFNNGKPDVVFMTYTGEPQTYTPGEGKRVAEYDEAAAMAKDAFGKAPPAQSPVAYSLPPPTQIKPSGVAANQPDSLVRTMFASSTYGGETQPEAFDQAKNIYDRVQKSGEVADHFAMLNDLLTRSGTSGVYNMTPGAYFGMMLRDLYQMSRNPELDESDRAWAVRDIQNLRQIWANVAAAKGQFIKGFDAGLRIANAPEVQTEWAEDLHSFDGSEGKRREFDGEVSDVVRAGDEFTKEQLNLESVEDTARVAGQGFADIAKGEDSADAGVITLESIVNPEIAEVDATANVTSQDWFTQAIATLSKSMQDLASQWLTDLELIAAIETMQQGGQFSLAPAAERSAAVQARIAEIMAAQDPKLAAQTELAAAKKRAESALRKLTAKPAGKKLPTTTGPAPVTQGTPGTAPATSMEDIQTMATDRLYKAMEKLVTGPAKGKSRSVADQTADAIVNALLNKAGLTKQTGGNADSMMMALGLLMANQSTAGNVLEDVHKMLQDNPATEGSLTRDNLKAFMQLAVGKTFDTHGGASPAAAPYGEQQIAAVLRAELKKAGLNLTETIRDAATSREALETLEAQLRDPARPFVRILSADTLNKMVNAVKSEYRKTARERATQLAAEQAKADAADAEKQKVRDAREESRLAAQEKTAAERAVRDAMVAQQQAAARWAAEQTKQAEDIAKEAQKAVRDAMAAEQRAIVAEVKAAAALTERVKRDAERTVRENIKAQQRTEAESLRVMMRQQRQNRAEARRAKVAEMRTARADGTTVPAPEKLDWKDIKELNQKLAADPNKALAVLAREFGFDLEAAVSIIRETDRQTAVSQMTQDLANALGMNQHQAAKFVQPVIAAAMKKVTEKRAKEAQNKIASFIKRKDFPDKKKQKTEPEKLMDLVRLGALTEDNVEDVMLNTRGAKKFTKEFRDHLIALAEKANDMNLPDTQRAEYSAQFNDEIKAARGVSALGMWGETIMSNIFMAFGTMKVNAVWGAVKAFSDSAAYIARLDPFNQNPEAQLPKGARKILFNQLMRGHMSDLQYQFKYLLKTGRSSLENDPTTQFANSDLELISRIPETEIKAWLNGDPMSPRFQKYAKMLTKFHKWTRRAMVGTDIFNRTPAYEMIKANLVLKTMVEKGQNITQKDFDDAMYDGDFDTARKESWDATNKAVADGTVTETNKGLYFGELMEARMLRSLKVDGDTRNNLLEKAAEQAKRWTVANVTEGIMGVVTNSLLGAIRDTPGLKFLLPAVRMPIGAFYQGLDWSPYGFLRAKAIGWNKGRSSSVSNALWNRNMDKKGWNLPAYGVPEEMAIELRNKAALGTTMMIAMTLIIQASIDDDEDEAEFYITGKGPEDPQANKLWREKGMQPFTIRLGGVNIRYQESPAFGPLMALGAWSDANRYGKPGDTSSDRLTYALGRTISGFADAAVMRSLHDVLGVITGGTSIEAGAANLTKTLGRVAGLSTPFPRLGAEINQILYGQPDAKEGSWGGYMFANIPFVSSLFNKPAINFFGEELHETRGVAGEVLPMLAHRITTKLTDDPQARFVSRMGANKLSTTRRFQDGTEVAENYEAMREWAKTSGQAIRKWLTPERIDFFEKLRAKDVETAEKEFDKSIRSIREDRLRQIKGVVF